MSLFKKKKVVEEVEDAVAQEENALTALKRHHERVRARIHMLRERIRGFEDIITSDEQHIAQDTNCRKMLIMNEIVMDKLGITDEEYSKYAAKVDEQYPEYCKRIANYKEHIELIRSSIKSSTDECGELSRSCISDTIDNH